MPYLNNSTYVFVQCDYNFAVGILLLTLSANHDNLHPTKIVCYITMVLGTCCSLLLQRVSVLVEHYFLCWNLRLHLYWCITVALIFNNLTILGILSSDQPTLGLDILYSLFSVILFHYACHSWSYYAFKVDLLFLVQGYSLVDTHKNLVNYVLLHCSIMVIHR